MEQLTKAEEQVMQVLWQIKKGFVKDIIAKLNEEPKPPYNTISSVVRQLEKKDTCSIKLMAKLTSTTRPLANRLTASRLF